MRRLLFYIAAVAMAASCSDVTVEEFDPSGDGSATFGETTVVTMNLALEDETRVSVTPGVESTDPWTAQWSDGDYICVYSLATGEAKYLSYTKNEAGEAIFTGEVYTGENRVFYTRTQSCTTESGKVSVDITPYSSLETLQDYTMISSEVITIEGDGATATGEIYVTMQQLSCAIDLQVEFTGLPAGLALAVSRVEVGGVPEGGIGYVAVAENLLVDPSKGVDEEGFSVVGSYITSAVAFSFDYAIDVTSSGAAYDIPLFLAPFTLAADEMIYTNILFDFDGESYFKEFSITNTTGAEFTFARATHSYIKKSFDMSYLFEGMWLGESMAFDNSGGASADSPIEISTEGELAYLAALTNGLVYGDSSDGKYYKLTSNLDLDGKTWQAIGSAESPFKGHFDGGGNTVSNLTINSSSDNQGLFGYASQATISDLLVEDAAISGANNVAVICGYAANDVEITSCAVVGGSVSSSGSSVAGVVGRNESSSCVMACYNTGLISGSSAVGGVVGYNDNGYIAACYNVGSLSGSSAVGAVVGDMESGSTNTCYYISAEASGSYGTRLSSVQGLNNVVWLMNGATEGDCYTMGDPSDSVLPRLMGESVTFDDSEIDKLPTYAPGGTLNGDDE